MIKNYNAKEYYAHLIGQKIGKWTVLDIVHNRKKPDAVCRCECGTERNVSIANLLAGLTHDCGCGRKKKLSDRSLDLVGMKFGKLTVLELLPERNNHKKRLYRCKCDCGNEVVVLGNSLKTNHTASCGCLNSFYNLYIKKYLDSQGIDNQTEFRVKINDVIYRYDFYLPDYNLFIEYDGIQHFEPGGFSGDKEKDLEKFKKVQLHDKIKNNYCKENNINLLRIPYYESKNIEKIIDSYLQRLSEGGSFTVMAMQQSELQL